MQCDYSQAVPSWNPSPASYSTIHHSYLTLQWHAYVGKHKGVYHIRAVEHIIQSILTKCRTGVLSEYTFFLNHSDYNHNLELLYSILSLLCNSNLFRDSNGTFLSPLLPLFLRWKERLAHSPERMSLRVPSNTWMSRLTLWQQRTVSMTSPRFSNN